MSLMDVRSKSASKRPPCVLCDLLPEALKEELLAGRSLPKHARPGPKSISEWLKIEHEIDLSPTQVQNCLARHGTYA